MLSIAVSGRCTSAHAIIMPGATALVTVGIAQIPLMAELPQANIAANVDAAPQIVVAEVLAGVVCVGPVGVMA